MKSPRKSVGRKAGAKRDVFADVAEGFATLAAAREGKQTLKTQSVAFKPAPKLSAKDVLNLRKKLELSRALFATFLRTNARTIENWEQGRAKPNAQAALLMNLVDRYPDTVKRLAQL